MEGVTKNCKILVGSWGHHLQGALQITTLCWNDTFQAFLGSAPHHPRLIYAWYDSISMPDTIPLEINVEWWGRESIGGAEFGQNTKVGVLGGHISQFHQILMKFFLSCSPISLLTPYIKMILGFSRIKHLWPALPKWGISRGMSSPANRLQSSSGMVLHWNVDYYVFANFNI